MTVCRIKTHKAVAEKDCPQELLDDLVKDNPVYYEYQRLGISTRGISPTIQLYRVNNGMVYIPRAINISQYFPKIDYKDERVEGADIDVKSDIKLREQQVPAVKKLAEAENGLLIAPCGSGKTVMAIEAIGRVRKTTLILVHKEFLLEQWHKNIREILGENAGVYGGGRFNWQNHKIVIGMLQSIYAHRDRLPEGLINFPGIVIQDETHRISAPTWAEVIQLFPAKRRWGLTATPNRPDGLDFIFRSHLGNEVYRIAEQKLSPTVYMVATGLYVPHRAYIDRRNKLNRAQLINYIVNDRDRNRLILRYLIDAAKAGRQILVLTERVNHAKFLQESFHHNLPDSGLSSALFIGETTKEERIEAVTKDVIFATSQMAKEALDIPTLDTLFLTTPIASPITVQQSTGRILREVPGKRNPLVLDFLDRNSVTIGMARKRRRIYDELCYDVIAIDR